MACQMNSTTSCTACLQGYLAHKKHSLLGPYGGTTTRVLGCSGGWGLAYERGTPVGGPRHSLLVPAGTSCIKVLHRSKEDTMLGRPSKDQ